MMEFDWRKLGLFVGYFVVVAVFMWPDLYALAAWIIGGFLSLSFVYIDRCLYVYVTRPDEPLSQAIRQLLKAKHYRAALRLVRHRGGEQVQLIGQSVIFMVVFIPLGLYVISSTGSLVAIGLLLGIGWHLLIDIVWMWNQPEILKRQLFWPVKRVMHDNELKLVVGLFALAFIGLSYSVIR